MKKLIILFLMLMPVTVSAVKYKFTDLGTLGGASSAFAINDNSQIVGSSTNSAQFVEAFLYENGEMKGLGGLATFGNSIARSINNNGMIVGESTNSSRATEAFLYENGEMQGLGRLVAFGNSIAFSINDSGMIVGASTNSSRATEAFLYENGEMNGLGALSRISDSIAYSINNRSQIVGESTNTLRAIEAFLYEDGIMNGLDTLGGDSSIAWSINDRGQIVGQSINFSGNTEAFLYENGVMFGLGSLGGSTGRFFSAALSINEIGQTVGKTTTITGSVEAFLYENGEMFRLNDLVIDLSAGWVLSEAASINDKGQIVGTGNFNNVQTAFLLDPVPEVSITSIENVKEGGSAQFEVLFETDPIETVDVTIFLGIDNQMILESPEDSSDIQIIQPDTATRNVDYDGTKVYDAEGKELEVVDENNRFTLTGLKGNTRFYVQTRQEFENNEGTEFLTAVLDTISDGAIPTATLDEQFASVSIDDVPVPQVSIKSIASIKEGEAVQFEVEFDLVPADPVDVILTLGVDSNLTLQSPVNPEDTINLQSDTATRNVDYVGTKVFDAEGKVFAEVDENNSFTLPKLSGNTEFYVQSRQEFQNNEGTESFTVVLESVSDGAIPTATLAGHFATVFIEEVLVPEISIVSNAIGVEGVSAQFDVGFTSDLQSESATLEITIVLGESNDTAAPGADYDGSQVYDANGSILAIVDENNLFTLENVAGTTSFFIRTFTDGEYDEEDEFFTATMVSYTDGVNLIPLSSTAIAQAIIRNEPLDVFISSQANGVEGFLAQFAVGTTQTLGALFDVTITLGAQGDNATPGVDYDIAQVYDANGAVLAIVDQNNRFTLEGVTGTTNFYVKTFTDQESNEEEEFFTATLDEVIVGGTLVNPDPVPKRAQAIIRNDPLEIFISSQSAGKEGYSAEFNITFNVLPQSAVDVIIMLGEQDDTATLGIDYERSRVYTANRVPLATVNGDTFTLTGLTGNTRFYVQTFREAPFLDDSVDHEGTESFTATLVSYKVGGNTIIPDTERSAKADIEELQPTDLITVSSNLDVYIPNMVQISENVDRFFMVTLKHAGGNIWVETARVPKAHGPNTIYYSTSPPDQDIDIFSGIYMGVPDGIEIFARLAFRGFNADGKMHWELTAAGEI